MINNIEQYLSGWRIDGPIGRGGYGEVYRIKKEELGYTYYAALKVIEIPSDDNESRNLNFMGMSEDSLKTYYEDTAKEIANEIRIMESLKGSGNIVHIEEHSLIPHEGKVGWTILIRMELMETIQSYQKRAGAPDIKEVIKIGTNICSALGCCEEKRIIHRDVKPDNIFRSEFGEYKLGDFGIAKKLDNTAGAHTQKGTMAFVAPEIYRGEKYDNTVDIYSLGLMLYMYLNRQKPPFLDINSTYITAKMLDEAQWKRISGQILPPPVDAPPGLAEIVLKACHPDAKKRYKSAYDFKNALETWERENCGEAGSHDNTIVVNPWYTEKKVNKKPETIIKERTLAGNKQSRGPRRINDRVVNMILVGLCVILGASIISGAWYIYSYYHKPTASKKGESVHVAAVQQVEQDNTKEAQQPEEKKLVLENYFGKTKDDIRRDSRLADISRFMAVYTDKNVNINGIVKQFPAWGTEIDPSKDRLSFYYSKGDLTNDQGYWIKTDRKEIHLKKGERTSITISLVAPNGFDEGYIDVSNQHGLSYFFDNDWAGYSFTFDIGCYSDRYKSGMIQICFLETKESTPREGSYCNVYYTIE